MYSSGGNDLGDRLSPSALAACVSERKCEPFLSQWNSNFMVDLSGGKNLEKRVYVSYLLSNEVLSAELKLEAFSELYSFQKNPAILLNIIAHEDDMYWIVEIFWCIFKKGEQDSNYEPTDFERDLINHPKLCDVVYDALDGFDCRKLANWKYIRNLIGDISAIVYDQLELSDIQKFFSQRGLKEQVIMLVNLADSQFSDFIGTLDPQHYQKVIDEFLILWQGTRSEVEIKFDCLFVDSVFALNSNAKKIYMFSRLQLFDVVGRSQSHRDLFTLVGQSTALCGFLDDWESFIEDIQSKNRQFKLFTCLLHWYGEDLGAVIQELKKIIVYLQEKGLLLDYILDLLADYEEDREYVHYYRTLDREISYLLISNLTCNQMNELMCKYGDIRKGFFEMYVKHAHNEIMIREGVKFPRHFLEGDATGCLEGLKDQEKLALLEYAPIDVFKAYLQSSDVGGLLTYCFQNHQQGQYKNFVFQCINLSDSSLFKGIDADSCQKILDSLIGKSFDGFKFEKMLRVLKVFKSAGVFPSKGVVSQLCVGLSVTDIDAKQFIFNIILGDKTVSEIVERSRQYINISDKASEIIASDYQRLITTNLPYYFPILEFVENYGRRGPLCLVCKSWNEYYQQTDGHALFPGLVSDVACIILGFISPKYLNISGLNVFVRQNDILARYRNIINCLLAPEGFKELDNKNYLIVKILDEEIIWRGVFSNCDLMLSPEAIQVNIGKMVLDIICKKYLSAYLKKLEKDDPIKQSESRESFLGYWPCHLL